MVEIGEPDLFPVDDANKLQPEACRGCALSGPCPGAVCFTGVSRSAVINATIYAPASARARPPGVFLRLGVLRGIAAPRLSRSASWMFSSVEPVRDAAGRAIA